MSQFNLNPAALRMFEPRVLMAEVPATGHYGLTAVRSRQRMGCYTVETGEALAKPQYQDLQDKPRYERLLEVMASEGYAFSTTVYPAGFRELLVAQLDVVADPKGSLAHIAAFADAGFAQQADRLEQHLRHLLPAHKAGMTDAGCGKCWAMRDKRRGVFVWPEWSLLRHVRVVADVPDAVRPAVLTSINRWLDAEGLRMAAMPSF